MKEPSVQWLEERRREVIRVAHEIYRQRPHWMTFLREVLGETGVARRLFPDPEAFAHFEKSPEYERIQQMLTMLRRAKPEGSDDREPTRVITVRLPKTLHELLRAEAHRRQTSMNKLCIAKLLQVVDEEMIESLAELQAAREGESWTEIEIEEESESRMRPPQPPDLPGLQDFGEEPEVD